jgi:hypothetical protein
VLVHTNTQSLNEAITMDEKRTLKIGGWIFGTLLGGIFILNALSLPD